MKTSKLFLLILTVFSLFSCGSARQATSTIVGGNYDAKKDVTEYFVFPYGQVSIPGKWEKTTYNSSSRQQFFCNDESVSLAVAFGPIDQFEFNLDGKIKGYEFVEAYYRWEEEYFSKNGLECKILDSDSEKKYIVFKVFGKGFDTVLLFGEKNGFASNFSVHITDKWTEEQKVDFLKNLF